MNDLAKTANGSFNANLNGTYTADGNGISGAITSGIEQGVQRVMSALNINLNVDGNLRNGGGNRASTTRSGWRAQLCGDVEK